MAKVTPGQAITGAAILAAVAYALFSTKRTAGSQVAPPPPSTRQIQTEGDIPTDDPDAIPAGYGINLEPEELE